MLPKGLGKLGQLPHQLRSALNLNIGSSAQSNINNLGSTASPGTFFDSNAAASSLGNAGNSASSAGGAKWHAGRSYGYHAYSRGTSTAQADPSIAEPSSARTQDDENDEFGGSPRKKLATEAHWHRRWRNPQSKLRRTRSSSLTEHAPLSISMQASSSQPGDLDFTGDFDLDGSDVAVAASVATSPQRSSPYSFTYAQLQMRYGHGLSRSPLQKHPSGREKTATTLWHPQLAQHRLPYVAPLLLLAAEAPKPVQIRSVSTTALVPPRKSSRKHRSLSTTSLTVPAPSSVLTTPRMRRYSMSDLSTASATAQFAHVTETSTQTAEPGFITSSTSVDASPEQQSASDQEASHAAESSSEDLNRRSDVTAIRSDAAFDIGSVDKVLSRDAKNIKTYKDDKLIPFINFLALVSPSLTTLREVLQKYLRRPSAWTPSRHGRFMNGLQKSARLVGANVTNELLELWEHHFKHNLTPDGMAHNVILALLVQRSLRTSSLLEKQRIQNTARALAFPAQSWVTGARAEPNASYAHEASDINMTSSASLAAMRQQADEDYTAAKQLLSTLGRGVETAWIEVPTLDRILEAAALRGDIDTALSAFTLLENGRNYEGKPRASRASPESFKNLLGVYAKNKDKAGVETVWRAFINRVGRGKNAAVHASNAAQRRIDIAALTEEDRRVFRADKKLVEQKATEQDVTAWNAIISATLGLGDKNKALSRFANMQDSTNPAPHPASSTILALVGGSASSGDFTAAFHWAARAHSDPPAADLPAPPQMSATLISIISAIDIDKLSTTLSEIESAADANNMLQHLGSQISALHGQPMPTAPESSSNIGINVGPAVLASPISSSASSHDSLAASSGTEKLSDAFTDATSRSQRLDIESPAQYDRLVGENERVPIDLVLSSRLDGLMKTSSMSAVEVYEIMKSERRRGHHAHPEVLARLIDRLAAAGAAQSEQLRDTYIIAYNTLASLAAENDRTAAWAYLEDRMLIAMADSGNLPAAATHRDRLLKAGAAPSADSYAHMITAAKDTTDDATVALELFEEARKFGVIPNIYLFNIVISKLSKARRTHLALSYFEQMKSTGIRPSAVTYGSVIAACCRTGDEKAAVYLFDEMTRSPGYKPRVPPYNTMVQFYVTSQPNREKALLYFDKMLRAKIAPTGHTYKLLLDAYGTIAPPDLASVRDVFDRLVREPSIQVTGTHWASLIHAHGITLGDFQKATQVFDSIADHASSQTSKITMPDVICYEALFNVLHSQNQTDLIDSYLQRMQTQFVRPTAYIYNTLIRANAAAGNVDKARSIFESLSDPQSGVAATGNHSANADAADVMSTAPVYREPSTYEAMIRCEMQAGEEDRAKALLDRAVARAFPAAVVARLGRLINGEEKAGPLFVSSHAPQA